MYCEIPKSVEYRISNKSRLVPLKIRTKLSKVLNSLYYLFSPISDPKFQPNASTINNSSETDCSLFILLAPSKLLQHN